MSDSNSNSATVEAPPPVVATGKTTVRRGLPPGYEPMPHGGFKLPDGSLTPAARRTAAAARRERLISEDVTTLAPFDRLGEQFFIACWGRDDRARWREDVQRATTGALVISEDPDKQLTNAERLSVVSLLLGVREADGAAFFSAADILAYRDNSEDDELLADLLVEIVAKNPRIFPPDATVATGAEKKMTSAETVVETPTPTLIVEPEAQLSMPVT